ncbi:hypothetical protein C5C63_12435 [Rathayibacter sp. AY1B8]|nr:hypothetical protein C5C63_12435 [Rathayibacter sp. AY1B8]
MPDGAPEERLCARSAQVADAPRSVVYGAGVGAAVPSGTESRCGGRPSSGMSAAVPMFDLGECRDKSRKRTCPLADTPFRHRGSAVLSSPTA